MKKPTDADALDAGGGLIPTAWLFTRGAVSIRMEVTTLARGVHLIVEGPGDAVASYEFDEPARMLAFAREREVQLIEAGFTRHALAERRSGTERRVTERRPATDRRNRRRA